MFKMPIVLRCKCVVIGDTFTGKTSIVKSLTGPPNSFSKTYNMTFGVEISSKIFRIANSGDDLVELYIYDFSGKPLYKDVVNSLVASNVSLIVGVFDVTNEDSFSNLQRSLADLMKQVKSVESVVGVIIGNKCDLNERRCISSHDGHQLSKRFKMRYFDCSAKEATGIDEAFQYLANTWYEMHQK
ncbi:intraflagellar transport protein 27-like protein [Dinothrombium tinctorium]|uniref:Intraflagellar transport protein 27-like protein n=1 Tax=Dinothrombium tinctorium TaxID=1965070 RepID=A0A3S3PJL3_9ACAR|nr:intraflagellar transport protein 27-like protein [Dinothrombium tinctorium]